MKKKVITFLMAVFLVMSSVPLPTEAAETPGTDNLIDINETNFPDAVFREYLTEEYDTDGDKKINPDEVTEIYIYGPEENDESEVKSLKGIELFSNLEFLSCGENGLTSLDVSHNPKLTKLYCEGNPISSLNIGSKPSLTYLSCEGDVVSSLDLSQAPNLEYLYCFANPLTSLDVSKNPNLKDLYCFDNTLTSLDVSKNPNLERLMCDNNYLTRLDLSANKKLWVLSCDFDSDFTELILPSENVNIDFYLSEEIADFSKIKGIDFNVIKDSRFDKTNKTIDITKLKSGYEDDEIHIYDWDAETSGWPCNISFYLEKDLSQIPDIPDAPITVPDVDVSYRTHVQSIGWQPYVSNGAMAGTSGLAKRLEGINIQVNGNSNLGIQYTTHVQSYGWLPWSSNGDMSGTEGEAKRLEAIKIQLTGADKDKYDIYYRVHAQSYGWLGWAMNGAPAGTAGYAKRLEGIQVLVVKKGEMINQNQGGITSARSEAYIALAGSSPVVGAPATSNTDPTIGGAEAPNVSYRTHVQSYGWQGWKYNGQMSGTSGQAKRLEGINIKLTNKPYSGGICYTTHVQSYGWQGDINNSATWKKDGEMAGTSGQAKRLEAIMIKLTGEMAEHYDVYYRVHAQSYGWLGWAKNGDPAGTAGYAKRLEGIQIVLVPKGGAAPSNSYGGINSANGQAYIAK